MRKIGSRSFPGKRISGDACSDWTDIQAYAASGGIEIESNRASQHCNALRLVVEHDGLLHIAPAYRASVVQSASVATAAGIEVFV